MIYDLGVVPMAVDKFAARMHAVSRTKLVSA